MRRLRKSELDGLVAEATVDAHDEWEQLDSFQVMLQDNLAYPFRTRLLGIEVVVTGIAFGLRPDLVFICVRGGETLRVGVLDLPRPSPPPEGWQWVEAYRHWAK